MTTFVPTTLTSAPIGSWLRIVNIRNQETATIAMRLGISTGETVRLVARIPGGPIVFCRDEVEIAMGRNYCLDIDVEFVSS